jgi:hypothetical protein
MRQDGPCRDYPAYIIENKQPAGGWQATFGCHLPFIDPCVQNDRAGEAGKSCHQGAEVIA